MTSSRLLLPGLLLMACAGCSSQTAMRANDEPAQREAAPWEAAPWEAAMRATPEDEPAMPANEDAARSEAAMRANEDATQWEAAMRATNLRIRIAAVGDMMLGTDYPQNHLPDDDGAGFLRAVTPVLSAADIAFGNLEGVLADGGEPGKKCSNPSACYLFRSPTRYAEHFRAAGFDVLSLANNHARDFGEEGRTATMQALDAAGIRHSGREGEFASFEVNALKIALLAYAVTKDSNMLLDYELAEQTVRHYASSHDIVIVTFHGGAEGATMMHVPFAEEEYFGEPRGDVAMFARRMVDAGADLVLGHGPHVVRGIELYRERLIAYSLGNFATYYGISVDGAKGLAPILLATLDGVGRFVDGEIVSTVQLRPDGPSIDPQNRAFNLIRGLSIEDFNDPGIVFTPDGRLLPKKGSEPFLKKGL